MAEKPIIICLTPVKNEDWILKRFLQCASLWADHIVIADQGSADDSIEICKRFPKTIIVNNNAIDFDEYVMRSTLINEARKISGKRILVALDADEVLAHNSLTEVEWEIIKNAKKGTDFFLKDIDLWPNLKNCRAARNQARIFVDDESNFKSRIIHGSKLPPAKTTYQLQHLQVIHYQFTDWERMESKHRWYQAWEKIHFPKKSIVSIYRRYHHMYHIKKDKFQPIEKIWFEKYKGIDMLSVNIQKPYYWDLLIIDFFKKYGTSIFSNIDLWKKKWDDFNAPRNVLNKALLAYLEVSQRWHKTYFVKMIDKILKLFV